MKRSQTSITENQKAVPSQSKRRRPLDASQEKENILNADSNLDRCSSLQNIPKKSSQISKQTNNNVAVEQHPASNTIAPTLIQSSISISSTSSSSSKNTPVHSITSTNNNSNKKSSSNENQSMQHQQKDSKTSRRLLNNNVTCVSTQSCSQLSSTPTPSSVTRRQTNQMKNATQNSYFNNSSASSQPSSLSNPQTSPSNNGPINILVEGSLEYRELKRLYLKEKNLAEEWRKDYQTIKNQLIAVRSSTIPRPTAEVVEWLQELFNLMDHNAAFVGDGRTLEELGEDLEVDPVSLATVVARTPQKSALKLFRLLYPTVRCRAQCLSISNIPQEQLHNIYLYVRTLHPNLNFNLSDMRRAIGTSIRSANSDLRRMSQHGQPHANLIQNNQMGNVNQAAGVLQNNMDEGGEEGDEAEEDDEGEEDEDGDNVEGDDDDEDSDKEREDVGRLMIYDEAEED